VSQTPFEFSHILNPFTGNNVPTFSVDDVKVAEGDSGSKSLVFTVTLSKPLAQTTTVNYASADGSAKAGSDYTSTSGTVSFAPGETAKTVSVSILGDLTSEGDETFSLVLSSAVGAAIAKSNGVGTIVDDDAPPSISVNDASLTEGNSGTGNAVFTVTLSRAAKAGETIAVTYKTADATAIAPGDYQSATGTIAFAAGQTAASVTVKIVGDTTAEPSETFTLNLSNPVGATFARNAGIGTIVDDDTPAAQVTYAITSQWDGGFIGQVTIKNTTNKAWTGWTLEWDAAFSLVNIWSVTLSSIVNGHFVIKPADWTRSVAPGASITFGFEARGAAATPSGIRLTPVF
jgi:chitinase